MQTPTVSSSSHQARDGGQGGILSQCSDVLSWYSSNFKKFIGSLPFTATFVTVKAFTDRENIHP